MASVAAAGLLAGGITVNSAFAGDPVQTGEIRGAGSPDAVDGSYIVVLKDQGSLLSDKGIRTAARTLSSRFGTKLDHTFGSALNGFTINADKAEAQRLAADPAVAFVEQNQLGRLDAEQFDAPWNLDRIDQPDLPLNKRYQYATTADGVTAYVVDSGIRGSHTEFESRAGSGRDFVDDDSSPDDCNGHGTHVAGTVGGKTYGVAKGVKLVPVRVGNCEDVGSIQLSDFLAALDWIADTAKGPSVVNISSGFKPSDAIDAAIRTLVDKGVTVVTSAGNDGADACGQSPAREPSAITVAASDQVDRRPNGSNYGKCVDIFAPGVDIVSAGLDSDTASATLDGTSMSAPAVTGAAALYLAQHPEATPAQVAEALTGKASTEKVRNPGAGSPNRLLFTGE
ncbi:S8 family peptidase [Streptomyces sp. KR80]|uniref:S8 family peptidase n=1 Tax=Streptomyces sp. KR80 TaxID=3457426 RepID=UPI003FD3B3F4